MGSPGSQTPPAFAIASSNSSGRRNHTGSLLLRVLAVALVLNFCHVPLTNAKQISNVFDDDTDFMLADEASLQSNSDATPIVDTDDLKIGFDYDADEELPLEEEQQPSGSWLSTVSHRVRRSLSRFFGGEQKEQPRQRRRAMERQRERRRQAKEQRQLEARQRQELKERQRQQEEQARRGPFKRDSFDETEGSGTEVDQEQDFVSYRVSFTLNEPYQEEFNDPDSEAYLQLQKSLEDDLRSFFDRTYPNLVDELDIRSILVRADPTDDSFKVNVLLKLQIPERITDFRNKFFDQLTNYKRIENLGASADENFSFTEVQDPKRHHMEGSAAAPEPRVSFEGGKRIPNLNLATDEPETPSTPSVFDAPVQSRADLGGGKRIFSLNLQPDDDAPAPPEPTTTAQYGIVGSRGGGSFFPDRTTTPSVFDAPVQSRADLGGGKRIFNLNLFDDDDDDTTTTTTTTTQSSSPKKGHPSCFNNYFRCDNNQFIMCDKACNSVQDCLDGSDESNCEGSETELDLPVNNPEVDDKKNDLSPDVEGSGSVEESNCRGDATFTCRRSGRVICDDMVCDGNRDCADAEDEENCNREVCNDSEFKCDNKCLPLTLRCDNRYDCEDQTDEAGCLYPPQKTEDEHAIPEPLPECASNEFRCNNGQCIDERRRCDYKQDCPDGEDESEDCPTACSAMEYQCSDGTRCISVSQTCDGHIDCSGGDDEEHCDGSGDIYDGQCRSNDFQCHSGECIPMRQVCDNIYDCNDNSDELACAQSSEEDRVGIPIGRPPSSWIHEEDEGEYILQNSYHNANAKNPCQANQFRCTTTNVCIPLHLRCDKSYHCNDLSDELGCDQYVRPVSTRRPPKVTTLSPWDEPGALNQRTTTTTTTTTWAPPRTTTTTTTDAPPRRPAATQPSYPSIETTTTNPLTTVGVKNNSSSSSSSSSSLGGGGICLENTEFACHNHDCIPIESVCDGIPDCDHNEDEDYELCNCSGDMFKCLRGGRCIEKEKVCDGKSHCLDGSDESACPGHGRFNKSRLGVECMKHQTQCGDGSCIEGYKYCNGIVDCADGADEDNCPTDNYVDYDPDPDNNPLNECDILQFECDYGRCLPIEKQCDGKLDCDDETDERDCPAYTDHCLKNEFECDDYCLPREHLCNGISDCRDGRDERDCHFCRDDAYLCNTGECVASNQRCDGTADCADGSDERHCVNTAPQPTTTQPIPPIYPIPRRCQPYEWQCENLECIDSRLYCNDIEDCTDGSDEICLSNGCAPNQFRCQNGDCVPDHSTCDGITQCRDGSDELNCGASHECLPSQFRCNNGQCVSLTARCNGRTDCMDSSDEYNCRYHPAPTSSPTIITTLTTTTVGTTSTTPAPPLRIICPPTAFRCDNGPCISLGLRCNGRIDCPYDSSDETDCGQSVSNEIDPAEPSPGRGSNKLNLKTYPDSQIIKERYIREGREVIFRCRDEGPARAKVKWSRPGGRPLPPGFTDRNGRLEIPNIRVEDSGTYVCEAVGYASYIPGQRVTVDLNVERYNTDLFARPSSACSEYQATCMNGECIDKTGICDGTPDCSDGSDEQSCSHGRKCQPNQFMCANSKCVDRTWRCDGENDCGDNSDEASCDPEPSGAPCRYNEFGCRSGHCIPKSFQCDDVNDCLDGTDEIGCAAPNPIRPPPPLKSLLEGESLDLTCVATGNPTPTIVWRLNWGHVPEKCESKSVGGTGTLHCPDMRPSESGAYSCEIINTRGTHFVTPDTIVTVNPVRHDVCKNGFFNMLARSADECVKCFCFGVAESCDSANLFTYAIQPPILSHQVVSVELSPYREIVINEATGQDLVTMHHGIQFRASNVQFGGRETPYLALPTEYMGNQLKSYGGNLRYEVSYMGHGNPVSGPDVIITGNRYTLTHRVHTSVGQSNKISIPFLPGGWQKPDGRRATREEIMMVLANVDNILIRLGYLDSTAREVELINIVLDSAGTADKGLGSVALVEKCACPPGYVGDSCESCAPGYTRQPGGSWLGHCVPFTPEPCPAGTYGDPRRGIACRECPCPQSGSNNYASGCQQRPDGDVLCNCHEGYTGRRCESCAAGYQGNPLIGDPCRKIPETSCNMDGTYKIMADGRCQCKDKVVGEHCDSCAANSFHLNSFTYGGCIDCFCSGLNVDCGSSTWSRDQVTSTFGRSRVDHGFQLVRGYTGRENINALRLNDVTPEGLRFSGSADNSGDTLYWSLPAGFLGNKLTAYGGKLSYTLSYSPLPGGIMSRNSAPDVVIRSGEDMTLIHYRKSPVSPSVSNTYAVEIKESAWQRTDGHFAERPHVLMALSDIKAIYIKATYTTSTQEGSLQQVSLDTATATNLGTQRAVEVEQCRCPPGYTGLSCETCAPGYRRDPEEGIYLGLCVPCECNGHSNQCHSETGECLDCGHNTEGPSCDRCLPGYVGNPSRGTPYDCQPDGGYEPPRPDPDAGNQTIGECTVYCQPEGTTTCRGNYCQCKQNVIGDRCDQCRPGTYGLSQLHAEGCKECYCSGLTSQCRSVELYRQQIPEDFISSPPLLTDSLGDVVDTQNLDYDVAQNMYTYSYPSYTDKYWSLQGRVLGNQLLSYGGLLQYTLQVKSSSVAKYKHGQDVLLIGNGLELIWSRPDEDSDKVDFSVRLHEDERWQRREAGSVRPATRQDFMTVLTNLEHILIYATPMVPTDRTSIGNVILETASQTPAGPGAQFATDIEVCHCPSGYTGNSCETCAPLHYRDQNGACRQCPCDAANSVSCALTSGNYVQCQCKPHWKGDQCREIDNNDDDYSGTTRSPDVEDPVHTQIIVSIAKPQITIIPVGGSLTLTCSGYMRWSNAPVFVNWYKQNSRLPLGAEVDGGDLYLHNLQIHDSGVYICQAVNNETARVFEDTVSITISTHDQRSPAQVVSLPQTVTFEEYQTNQIICEVEGNPTPTITWTRVDGQADAYSTRTQGNRLIFDSPRKSDEGRYRCQADNELSRDEKYVHVYVQSNAPHPPPAPDRLYITPEEFNGVAGETIRLTCSSTSDARLRYDWNHDGYPLSSSGARNVIVNDNYLEVRDATARDSGIYTCLAYDPRTRRNFTVDARVNIESRDQPPIDDGASPVITPLQQQILIFQGRDHSITCEANGTPYPSIKWTKVHAQLANNVRISGNILTIYGARQENIGLYTCIAENANGSDQSSTYIDIEPREAPSVKIDLPQQTQTVGGQVALYCTAFGIPQPQVEWVRVDGVPLSPRHKAEAPGYVVINDVLVSDAGDYQCVAKNEVGEASGVANIRIIERPIVQITPSNNVISLTEGDELQLTCVGSGYPSPVVEWSQPNVLKNVRNQQDPASNTAYLRIYRVTQADAGFYTCTGKNEADTDQATIRVDVRPKRGDIGIGDPDSDTYEPPPRPYDPQGSYEGSQLRLPTSFGTNITLTCNISDHLTPQWERADGTALPSNAFINQNKLEIIYVQQENLGQYRCNGLDPYGRVETYVVREVVYLPLPEIVFYPQIPRSVETGSHLYIDCQVKNARKEDIYWATDNNRPLSNTVQIDGTVLHFISIAPADAGGYRCTASNQYGNTTKTAQVVVKQPTIFKPVPHTQVHQHPEGDSIKLSCSATTAYGEVRNNVQFQWYREDGSELPRGAHPNSQVLVLTALRPEDQGRYICNTYDLASRQHLPPTYVDLQVIRINMNRLSGFSPKDTPCMVLYICAGGSLVQPPPSPYIPTYLPPPTTRTPPRDYRLKLDQQSSNLHAGESTEVECSSTENTYTDVVWERADGAPLGPNVRQAGNLLIFNEVVAADAGKYVCKCRTDEGELYTTSYELNVEDQPHELKSSKIVHAPVGGDANLQCGADESRQPTYRWSRQYGQLQPGRSLTENKLSLDGLQANDAGTYICSASYRDGETVDFPSILVVTGAIPQFRQEPRSYMSFPTLPDSSFKFNFELTFRPETGDGLLLFNGQTRGSGDYIALSLKDRYAEFRFDFGGKPLLVRAEEPLALNEWHTVRVHRSRRDGYIQVDEQHPVAFPTLSQTPQLDLIEDLYLGGVPNWELLPADAVTQQTGFVGCISRLTLQGRTVELMREAKFKEGISDCRPCAQRPCSNGGVCLESQSEQAYTCVCQPGWTGRDCTVEGTQCTPGVCGTGRCENTELDMECLCPLNRTGDRCQYIEHLNEQSLNFKRNSYAAYGTPRVTRVNVTLSVRPSSLRDSVILYAAESRLPSGDYLALVLRGGHVELLINTAARLEPVVVRSTEPLPLHRWTRIEVLRRQGESILRVGDAPERKAKAPGAARTLSLKTPLFVGGYDRATVKINRDVNITDGFDGCISRLYESTRSVKLLADITDAANIQNCGELNEISEDADDLPVPPPPSPVETPSGGGSGGELEPYAMAPCANDPCENGGSCSEQDEEAVCSCLVGFSGKHCQEHIQIGFNASFRGNGYLEINRNQFNADVEQQFTSAVVVFTTTEPNGLLLWWGQKAGVEYTGQDFIALAVVDGYVEFNLRLDGEEAVIRNSDTRVDDGNRHIVIVKRNENTAILEVDRILHSGETRPTAKKEMKLPGHVFIGGIPNIAQFTGERFLHNFNGCIVVVEGDASGQINLGPSAISGVNVNTCPIDDGSLEGTEPPVV
ncbi:basement membrane-specific heparan sulfate proteoglycan core protein isoform X8 [Drosophila bipectinata]|uniref:basement membrane-specific heparan sulfate proteoglycan core protein isoform X8 n=1 Tax=Drosophila bipectinata TaxID=42026 RepID=UPI0038B2EA0D